MIAFYICDLETNGLQAKNNFHEIAELSIIRAEDRVQLTRQVRVENIRNSSIDAMRITNKTESDYKKGISKKQLIEDVEGFLKEDGLEPPYRCLVGHNIINFDKKFLWQTWENFGKRFPFDLYLDTMHLSKAFAKTAGINTSFKLLSLCDSFGVKKVAGAHSAGADTRNCYLLWQKLMENVDYVEHIKRFPHITEEPIENDDELF